MQIKPRHVIRNMKQSVIDDINLYAAEHKALTGEKIGNADVVERAMSALRSNNLSTIEYYRNRALKLASILVENGIEFDKSMFEGVKEQS